MKTYLIQQGRNEIHPRIVNMHPGLVELRFKVKFTSSCYYDFRKNTDNSDINKLYGISWKNHHDNSYRIGWNCSKHDKTVQLYSYWYNKGRRYFKYLGDVPLEKEFNVTIKFNYHGNNISTRIENYKYEDNIKFDFTVLNGMYMGYYLYPYFGGSSPAPHTMQILMNR